MIFNAANVAVKNIQLFVGVIELGGIGSLSGGLGAPEGVREAEIDPALVNGREFQNFGLFVCIMSLGEGTVGIEFFGAGLKFRIVTRLSQQGESVRNVVRTRRNDALVFMGLL